jgi:putative thiamine transport system permease protein
MQALMQDAQWLAALALSLWTGLLATALAAAGAAWVLANVYGTAQWQHLTRWVSPMLAVPHAAFAIGLAVLVAPSGWLLRVVSPWATGLQVPPPWASTQDPWGLGLIAVLVLKEIPFLLWAAMAHLQRADIAQRLQRELLLCQTMGYSTKQAWWRVGWPQLLPNLYGPLIAVLAYGLTVVDVALVIGPTNPPTLAVLAWHWLQDADAATNTQGVAAAWVLAAVVIVAACVGWAGMQLPLWRTHWTRGLPAKPRPAIPIKYRVNGHRTRWPSALLALLLLAYAAVLMALALGSVIGSWPFPLLMPEDLTWEAWKAVAASSATVSTTVWIGLTSSATALVMAVALLELAPKRWAAPMQAVLYVPLVLPAVLWTIGLHRLALAWNIDATGWGLWLAHALSNLPYVVLALQGPYTGFDARMAQVASSLGRTRSAFLLQVKWPLLRAALTASFAVGFAVSVAQYLPTLYVGAGRFNTVTTEAVQLAAGGQRSLTAAYAWLQWALPVLVFGVAAWLGRARRFGTLNR